MGLSQRTSGCARRPGGCGACPKRFHCRRTISDRGHPVVWDFARSTGRRIGATARLNPCQQVVSPSSKSYAVVIPGPDEKPYNAERESGKGRFVVKDAGLCSSAAIAEHRTPSTIASAKSAVTFCLILSAARSRFKSIQLCFGYAGTNHRAIY